MTQTQKKEQQPHYHGHRQRLRERFLKNPDSLPDYEILELILFLAIPRKDVKPLAKEMIDQFGSLSAVLNTPIQELEKMNGLSDLSISSLKIVQAAGQRMLKQDIINKPILSNWQRLLDYCHATMAQEKTEQFRLLFLNKKNQLIADEVQQTGTVDHTPAYPREIIKRALELNATALILVHNHPSGDPTPSEPDIQMTKAIITAAKPFDIAIHDHLIISSSGISSFKSLGLV